MPKVVVTIGVLYKADGPYRDLLTRAGYELDWYLPEELKSDDITARALEGACAVVAGGESYNESVLSRVPQLRVISRFGVGYDRVDVPAATRHNVAVTITPCNHDAVAEHTMALMLAVTRLIGVNDRAVRAGRWPNPLFNNLRKKTLGLVGLGRIGRSVAVRAAAFGMNLLACDPFADPHTVERMGAKSVDFDTLLATSDIVSLHSPLMPATRGIFDKKAFARMKLGSYFVNTARGGLVIDDDLVEALRSGHLAGAGLDVFGQEPLPVDHPLRSMDNVVLSPHIAANDYRAIEDMGIAAAQNIIDLSRGVWPDDSLLNPEVKAGFRW